MFELTIDRACRICGGTFAGDESLLERRLRGITTDSRSTKPGTLFIPIVGDRYDGHDYIAQALAAGAACCLSERPLDAGLPHIRVPSTLDAYQALAAHYRSGFAIPFVGITGSVGKTTTKELIASVLSQKVKVHKNLGNLNNQIGVPATLLQLEAEHEAAVIEMGMNHFGEIRALSRMVRPDLCVFTNIGETHLEFLGSREGILRAKSEMLEFMNPKGHVVLNGDDALLATLIPRYPRAVTYGLSPERAVYAEEIVETPLSGTDFTAHADGRTIRLHVPSPGRHMVYNALAALACGLLLGLDLDSIARGIAGYVPTSGRMNVLHSGGITILGDAYNASPASMKAAIDIAAAAAGRKVCVLGDMLELGEDAPAFHASMGRYAVEKGIDLILCVGPLSGGIAEGAQEAGGAARHFANRQELTDCLPDLLRAGDTVLIKASHGMGLEAVTQYLVEHPVGG